MPDSLEIDTLMTDVQYQEFTFEFDVYRRLPSTTLQTLRIGFNDGNWSPQTGFYLELENSIRLSTKWNGSTDDEVDLGNTMADRWYHVKMVRGSGGDWTVTWDEGGTEQVTLTGQDQLGTIQNPVLWIEGYPDINSIHYDNFNLTMDTLLVWSDDFEDGNFSEEPQWSLSAGRATVTEIENSNALLVRGEDLFGNGINVDDEYSSFPDITFNCVYQPEGQGFDFAGVSLDSTNISVDPLFVDRENGDFHLQGSSECKHAASDGGEIGAYGKDPDW